MSNGRVVLSTVVLTALAWIALDVFVLPIPDGLAVLALAGTFGAAHFASLCVFDDGTRP